MKKIIYNIIIFLCLMAINVNAKGSALFDVYTSNKTPKPGETFTVTVQIKGENMGAYEMDLSYDSSIVKFVSAESGDCNNTTCLGVLLGTSRKDLTFTFKAIANGYTSIGVKNYYVIEGESSEETKLNATVDATSVTVKEATTITKPITYSTNNNLSDLKVKDYTLSPSFNKDTLNYTISVPSNIEEITIEAEKEDSKAKINGDGTHKVSEGDNKFTIVVTSEKGTTKEYVINVVVKDENPINVSVNNKNYTIIKRKSTLPKLENYKESEIDINGVNIPCLTNEITNYTLVGLKDETSKTKLFIYNKDLNTYQEYNELTFNNFNIVLLNNKTSYNLKKEEIKINDINVNAYKLNTNYYLIYGKNTNTGDEKWYTYEAVENTIQPFNENMYNTFQKQIDKANKLILIFASLSLIFAILLIISLITKNNKKGKNKKTLTFLDDNYITDEKTNKDKKNANKVKDIKDIKDNKTPSKPDNKDKEQNKDLSKTKEYKKPKKEITEINLLDKDDKNISKTKQKNHDEFKDL